MILLLVKLEAYGLDNNVVSFMKTYLTKRLPRCRINKSFSEWAKMSAGVPQGSTLGPLPFNIFINAIFFFLQLMLMAILFMPQAKAFLQL